MPSPYTTATALAQLVGASTLDKLGDFDNDGTGPDTGILDAAIARADRKIDAQLGRRYVVPFVDLPDTPGLVQSVSGHLAAVELLAQAHADGVDIAYHRREAERLLEGILDGTYVLLGAVPLSVEERAQVFLVDASAPVFAGVDPDTEESNMGSW